MAFANFPQSFQSFRVSLKCFVGVTARTCPRNKVIVKVKVTSLSEDVRIIVQLSILCRTKEK